MTTATPVLCVDVNGVPIVFPGGGLSTVNLTQVGGGVISLGQALNASSIPVALASDSALAISGTVTASGSVALLAGSALIGQVGLVPQTSGGATMKSNIILANTTAIVVKASPGQLYGLQLFNNATTIAYLKIYDATSATAGSGTPALRLMIPAPPVGGGGVVYHFANGLQFATGITYIVTTGIADADTGAPAATTYLVNAFYK